MKRKGIICILVVGILAGAMYSRWEENKIQMFDVTDVQQCIWGEWEIKGKYYGGTGWQN